MTCDRQMYKLRNHIELFFRRPEHFRRITTRYDKINSVFPAFIHLVLGFVAGNRSSGRVGGLTGCRGALRL